MLFNPARLLAAALTILLTDTAIAHIVYIDESRVSALPIVRHLSGDFVNLATEKRVRIDHVLTADELDERHLEIFSSVWYDKYSIRAPLKTVMS